jgi:hypothetical protein
LAVGGRHREAKICPRVIRVLRGTARLRHLKMAKLELRPGRSRPWAMHTPLPSGQPCGPTQPATRLGDACSSGERDETDGLFPFRRRRMTNPRSAHRLWNTKFDRWTGPGLPTFNSPASHSPQGSHGRLEPCRSLESRRLLGAVILGSTPFSWPYE